MRDLIVNGVNLEDCYKNYSFEAIKERVSAHGSTCHADRQESGRYNDYYGSLWYDANALVKLLENTFHNLSGAQSSKSNDFTISVGVELDGGKIARAVNAFNEVMSK